MDTGTILVRCEGIKKLFPVNKGLFSGKQKFVHALDDVSLEIYAGETLGLVGESGCGKSTLGRTLIRLIEPTEGKIKFCGEDITHLPPKELRALRQEMQIIFQDPYASLNPRMTIYEALEAPLINFHCPAEERGRRIHEIAQKVGLNEQWLYRYPHEFSGGQRQRIVISRALILKPKFVVCDEAVSALDVSVRSQVLNLMSELQKDLALTYLFISHDLSVIKHVSDRIIVMYLGRLVEIASKRELLNNPLHPYTQVLLASVPTADPEVEQGREHVEMRGEIPSVTERPCGCPFSNRCEHATERCRQECPALRTLPNGHQVACFLVEVAAARQIKK